MHDKSAEAGMNALDELPRILGRIATPLRQDDPALLYACALFAELPYYHVPEFECDERRRAKLVPCRNARTAYSSGRALNVGQVLRSHEIAETPPFTIVDRSVVVVGLRWSNILWLGFRGTVNSFDHGINARCRLGPPGTLASRWWNNGRVHSGFGEESARVMLRLRSELERNPRLNGIETLVCVGHSLGGAVAAITGMLMDDRPALTCVFGSPRFGDVPSILSVGPERLLHVRRAGDMVPTVPPRVLGYVDYPEEVGTDGKSY